MIANLVHRPRDWFNISCHFGLLSPVRLIVSLAFGFNCAAASAAVTCEQLANVAVTAQQLRDQGYSLAAVLAEADKLEASDKLTAAEIDRIRDVVEQAYKGSIRTPLDILQECKGKLPRRSGVVIASE